MGIKHLKKRSKLTRENGSTKLVINKTIADIMLTDTTHVDITIQGKCLLLTPVKVVEKK